MKKILALFTEKGRLSLPAILNVIKSGSFELHGMFLKSVKSSHDYQYPFLNDLSFTRSHCFEDEMEQEETEIINHCIDLMKDECSGAGIAFHAAIYESSSLDQLITQSSSADLLMLDANLNLKEYFETPSKVCLKDLLINLCCPVFLFNQPDVTIEKVILASDGSFSSIHAIKMYSLLFQDWKDLPTVLVSVHHSYSDQIRIVQNLNDWLPKNFTNYKTEILNGEVKDELVHFIQQQSENVLIVMGDYGGNAFSRVFHHSLASVLLRKTKASLFIAHE